MNILNKIASFFKTQTETSSAVPESQEPQSMQVSGELKSFLENEVLDGLDINPPHPTSIFCPKL